MVLRSTSLKKSCKFSGCRRINWLKNEDLPFKSSMNTEIEKFCPADKTAWRNWLKDNHEIAKGVWLIVYKKKSDRANLNWSEAVDEALCFGWIDSVKRPMDEERYCQYFGKRKPKSTWSKVNKDKIEVLIKAGLMTKAGLNSIETAKKNGSWTILDSVENFEIPADLEQEFSRFPETKVYFMGLSKSVQKVMLQWLVMAKRPETRQNRIFEIIDAAKMNKKPKQF